MGKVISELKGKLPGIAFHAEMGIVAGSVQKYDTSSWIEVECLALGCLKHSTWPLQLVLPQVYQDWLLLLLEDSLLKPGVNNSLLVFV